MILTTRPSPSHAMFDELTKGMTFYTPTGMCMNKASDTTAEVVLGIHSGKVFDMSPDMWCDTEYDWED